MSAIWRTPESWQWSSMGAVSAVSGGGTPSTQDASYFGGGVPWLTPADLSGFGGKYISAGERSLTKEGLKKSSAKMVPAGSILFTSRAPVGYVAIAEVPVCTNQGFKNFVLESDIAPSYCYYYLLSAKAHIQGMASGTTFLELPAREARKIPIPIAPKQEQVRIAAELDRLHSELDSGLAALQRCQEKLGRYRASVLKAAVEGELTAAWRERHPDVEPASELLQRILAERRRRWEQEQLRAYAEKGKAPPKNWKAKYKEPLPADADDLPILPRGWCWATVAQCASAIEYGSSAKADTDSTGVPVLRMGNITLDGRFVLDDLKYLPLGHPATVDLRLREGDLLFNRTNSIDLVGKTAIYAGKPRLCTFASYLIRVRLLPGVHPRFLMYALNGPAGRQWIGRVASQTVGQANVNGTKLAAYTFPLPPSEEQDAALLTGDEQLRAIDETETAIDAKAKQAGVLWQSVLHQAFTGKLVPQDPTDEPATALLERIARERKARARSRPANAHGRPA